MTNNGNLKILIVDDDSSILEVLSLMLEDEGYVTDTAENGYAALSKIDQNNYDIIVTDVIMPGGGIELLERLKLLYPELMTIVISASKNVDSVIQAMRLGAAGFVLKPFRREEILLSIRAALENMQLRERQGRLRILTELVDAGKDIAASLNKDILAQKTVEHTHRIIRSDSVSLMLTDNEQEDLYVAASIGLKQPFSRGYRVNRHEGLAGWALDRCFCLNLRQNKVITPEIKQLMTRDNRIKASICMPILSDGASYGVINVNNLGSNGRQEFDQSDMNFLSILSSHVAVCLRNAELFNQLEDLYEGSIQALSLTLQAKDTYTSGHSSRVATFASTIAEDLGMSISQRQVMWAAGILHDIGKIGTPEKILNKPSVLNGTEREIIQYHPVTGAEIITSIPHLKNIAEIVLHHHERYDGTGYPYGLKGNEIPIGSRILAIADSLEAMVSHRPYRNYCSTETILNELTLQKSKQFDPKLVDRVIRIIKRNGFDF